MADHRQKTKEAQILEQETTTIKDDELGASEKKAAALGELTQGNLWKVIWRMSWPLLLTTIAASLVGMTDLFVAGRLGSAPQAAVGISEQIIFTFLLFMMATGTGTTALVSRYWGSGNRKRAARFAGQSLALSITLGLCLSAVAQLTAHYALGFFTHSDAVKELGTTYLALFSFGMIPLSVVYIGNASFNAIGKSTTTLLVVAVMTSIQISGDFLTVIYNWPVAGLGIRGIAYSYLCGATASSITTIILLRRSQIRESLNLIFPIVRGMILKVINIGLPSAFQRIGWSVSVFGLFFILSMTRFPTEAQAAWAIGMRVEGLIFMPIMALSMAVASIVGQNLGAKQIDRAYRAGWRVTWVGIVMLSFMGVILFVCAGQIARLMSNDANTIAIVISYLRINALSEPFLALAMILSGALQGAGDTRSPMWITIFSNWCVRLPLAYLLSLVCGIGPSGAWWAMTASIALMGLLTCWRFTSKAWVKLHI